MNDTALYILSGLPGSGKTTVAQFLARRIGAAHVRIDTIERALRELCSIDVQGEGYRLAYRVASDILNAGVSVIADSCNPIELTRREWERVALNVGARYVNIEIVCSDIREYHAWTVERIVLDTSRRSERECIDELLSKVVVSR